MLTQGFCEYGGSYSSASPLCYRLQLVVLSTAPQVFLSVKSSVILFLLIAYLNHTECIFNRGKLRITNSAKVKTDSSYLPLS